MNPLTQSKNTTILPVLIALALVCFALSPQARAVCQEGCLTNLNTVLGDDALISNTGAANTAIGWEALFSNTTGFDNTANGGGALQFNTTGHDNTATGAGTLAINSTGSANTGTGVQALLFNTRGNTNTAVGVEALRQNSTGSDNIAVGFKAGRKLTTGSNNIDIGNQGHTGESNSIRIGTQDTQTATFIAGISGVAVTGSQLMVNSDGQLGVTASSKRFKEAIRPMDKASEAILGLKPVTFRYKHELDAKGIPQFGLVAEDVEKVNPDLVARDDEGKPYTVRYEAVNAMLLNEFLKARRQIDSQQNQIEALTAGLQKVSTQLELSKSATQAALNN